MWRESTSTQSSDTAAGSRLQAGGNVSITATGGGRESNIHIHIHIRGSEISAGNNVNLTADNDITVEAARNTQSQSSTSRSSNASVGVSYSFGSQDGLTFDAAFGSNRSRHSGTLTNRGLIDSKGSTQLNAGTLDNIGTGRIYRDAISIGVGVLNNDVETLNGITKSASIAARDSLDIGAGTLNNRDRSLIFSGNSMNIGGALDANGYATGQGSVLNNLSADIESLGHMSISMAEVNNRDVHIRKGTPITTARTDVNVAAMIYVNGGSGFYPLNQVRLDPANGMVYLRQPDGSELLVGMGGYGIWTNNLIITEETATNLAPARLVAGGNLTVNGRLVNQDSQVSAGGTLSATAYQPEQLAGTRTITGWAYVINHKGEIGPPVVLNIPPETLNLGAYKYEPNVNATQNNAPDPTGSGANVGANAGGAGGVGGSARPGTIVEVPAQVGVPNTAGPGLPQVVRTSNPNVSIPFASLFNTRPEPGSRHLVETDPRFANYRHWLSSDYLLDKLGLNPDLVQKRLGDGYYEQRLIREQIAQLTGYRYLDGFQNDEEQYAALMSAGATFAQQYGLRPGVALTAEQMAQLTSDIVWLVEQTVTLPDGSTQRVLVPQVYVRVRPGDIDGSGALLSADATVIKSAGDITNTGTIAGRTMVSLSAENVNNLAGGRIAGGSVGINAKNDIHNIGASITADNAAVLTAGRDINLQSTTQSTGDGLNGATRIDRVAGVYVSNPDGVLIASAGRDVNLIGAVLSSAGTASVGAGRNINLGTVTESSRSAVFGQGMAAVGSESREIGSVIQGAGNVRLAAGNDLNIRASAVASTEGALVATAKNDINLTAGQATSNLATATVSSSSSLLKKTGTSTFDSSNNTAVLSSSLSGNTVALVAGNDINAQAAQLRSDEAMSLSAGRDIHFTTATQTTQEAHASQTRTSTTGVGKAIGGGMVATGMPGGVIWGGALITGRSSGTGAEAITRNDAIGTTVSAGSLQTVSGRDTTLQAATVVADGDITMVAGRNLTIESAQNTSTEARHEASGKSGAVGTWYNPSVGNVKNAESTATFRTTQQASQVASLTGNVTLVAGNEYRQTASSVMAVGQAGPLAGGDVNILAKNVVINEAYNTEQSITLSRSSSTLLGGSASVAGLSTDSVRGAVSTVKAMGETSDSRMQALGAVNLAVSGKQAYDGAQALAGSGGNLSYGVSANLSRNESQSTSVTTSSQAVGSSVVGANNVNIIAIGGGEGSNILASGSTVAAGNTVNLAADNDITLQASKDTSVTVGQNSSSGANVGVTFGAGAQNGFSIQLGVSQGKGSNNQNDTRYNATQVSGGQGVNIASGGDLTLRGAVVDGNRVTADVGGDLNIETLQDVSVGASRQSSSGLNVSLCIPPICYGAVATVGGSAASAKANGVFISPNTQAGIQAGDGGFDVNVRGNTNLTGAVIESTQGAIDAGKNSFQTGGTLTMSDLQNVSQSSGSSYAVNGGLGIGHTTAPVAATDTAAGRDMTVSLAGPNNRPSGSAGVGSYSGDDQNSATRSGISGIAGDQSVRTGDNASAGTLVRDWNTQTIIRDVQAQAQLTQQFNQNAAREIGTYADKKYNELRGSNPTEAAKWAEGGEYRVALHTAAGALSGGVAGALGAGASAALMPRIGEAIDGMGLPTPVVQALGAVTAAAIGATAGGAAGAASAYSVDINNRQLHPTEIKWIKDNAKRFAQQQGISEAEAEKRLAQQAFRQVQFGVEGPTDRLAQDFLSTARQLLPGDPSIPGQTVGHMFYADPAQRANPNMYAQAIVSDPNALAFYAANGIVQPSTAQIMSAVSRHANARDVLTNLTWGAAGAAAALTVPPALSWCLGNPVACNRVVMAGGEIAAGDALGPAGLGAIGTASTVKAVRSAEEANAAMRARGLEPGWSPGTPVIKTELQPGTKVKMVISEEQYNAYRATGQPPIGGWATFDDVASQAAARQNLALLSQFKKDVGYVIEYEIAKPLVADIGFVGKQTESAGQLLRGGGTQVAFDWSAGINRSEYLKMIGAPQPLSFVSR